VGLRDDHLNNQLWGGSVHIVRDEGDQVCLMGEADQRHRLVAQIRS